MPAKRVNPKKYSRINSKNVFIVVSIIFISLLTVINFDNYFHPKKVLGVETVKAESTVEFWPEFLKNHPDYIPGWIEEGDIKRVKQIDPNYLLYQ